MKVTITIEDKPDGTTGISTEFDPPAEKQPMTGACQAWSVMMDGLTNYLQARAVGSEEMEG